MTTLSATNPKRERGTDPARDSLLARVVDEYLAACRAGQRPDVEALVAQHPEIADDLTACLASLDFLENIAQQERLLAPPAPGEYGNGASLRRVEGTLGDFRILGEIGRGGMGVVYEAQQISLNRRVALKVLPFAAILDERAKKRFQNEALAAAQLDHPHIVDVYGVGCERGVHYYAMRLIDGRSLAEIIQHLREQLETNPKFVPSSLADLVSTSRKTASTAAGDSQETLSLNPNPSSSSPAPSPQSPAPKNRPKLGPTYYRAIATLGMHVAEALDHAHEQGVLHRDIKPSNLMLDSSGKVWITDFGLARIESAASLTHTGDLLGTLRYMSPEQALAQRVPIDHRCDIYSLGVTLYELLTLRPAFESDNRGELLRQVAFEEPVRPRQIDPQIPLDLETIVLKAVEKSPNDRYQTATELAADLKRYVEDRLITASRPSLYSRALKWSRRHVEWVVSASVVAVILLAATTLVTLIAAARERERTTERLRLNQEIGEELRQAVSLTQTANSAKGNDRLLWGQAREHAQRAAALAKSETVDLALRQEVATVLTDLDERQRDWVLLAAIDSAWLAQLDTNQGADEPAREKVAPIFADAIASFGIEMGRKPPEDAARKIGSRPRDVQLAVITMLDELLYYPEEQRNPWIEKVLALVDQNAWRAAKRLAIKIADPKEKLAALQKLAAAKEADDQPAMAIAHVGSELHVLGDEPGAIVVMRNAAQRNPTSPQLNHYLGSAFGQASAPQWQEAVRYATAAASLQPKNPFLMTNLAYYLLKAGKLEEAFVQIRQGLQLKPDSAELHLRLADALWDQGQQEEALKEYRFIIQLKPDFGRGHFGLGIALCKQGKLDEALAEVEKAIHFSPQLAEAHGMRGDVLRDQRKLDEAIAAYQEAIRLKPGLAASAYSNMAIALQREGKLDEALAAVERAIHLQPDFAPAHVNRGNILRNQRRLDESIAACQQAIRLEPGRAIAHVNLGETLDASGKRNEAVLEYREAIRLNPKLEIAHTDLARSLRRQGNREEAAVALKEALRIDPDMASAHCALASLLADKGDFQGALEEMRKGHELGSRDQRWPHPTAQWLVEAEQLAKVDAQFSELLQGTGPPPSADFRIMMATFALAKKHLPETAVKWFEQAFAEDPSLADNVQVGHRYNAACAALLTAAGKGNSTDKPDDAERTRLQHQALVWLQADLAAWEKLSADAKPEQLPQIVQALVNWQKDPDLASLRDEKQVQQFSLDDQELRRQLWTAHTALVKRLSEMLPAAGR